jgi:hypothetical protein
MIRVMFALDTSILVCEGKAKGAKGKSKRGQGKSKRGQGKAKGARGIIVDFHKDMEGWRMSLGDAYGAGVCLVVLGLGWFVFEKSTIIPLASFGLARLFYPYFILFGVE